MVKWPIWGRAHFFLPRLQRTVTGRCTRTSLDDQSIERCFNAVSEMGFPKNVFQMALDSCGADAQTDGYLFVGFPKRDEGQNSFFRWRQLWCEVFRRHFICFRFFFKVSAYPVITLSRLQTISTTFASNRFLLFLFQVDVEVYHLAVSN